VFYDHIEEIVEDCRYCHQLGEALRQVHAVRLLFLNYVSDYQGNVDISALLSDGRVFSYEYSYGSCSGCDSWEAEEASYEDVVAEMIKSATYFDSEESWKGWMSTRTSWRTEEPLMSTNVAEERLKSVSEKIIENM